MGIAIRNFFLALAALSTAASLVPAFALAQTATAQVVVVTQTNFGNSTGSGTVTVTGSGPSLTATPSSNSTLSYSAGFNGDSRVITLIPGNYSVVASNNQSVSYSSDCSGYAAAGQSRTCTISANSSQSGNARVNVSVNVVNNYGGNRTAGDFTVSVSGSSVNVSSFSGSTGTTQVTLGNGSYSIDIQNPSSYFVTRSADCSGTINSGDTRSCLLTLSQNGNGTNYNSNGVYYVNGSTCYYGTNYPVGSTCYNGSNYNNYNNNGGVYYVNGSTCYYGTTYYNGSNCYNGSSYNTNANGGTYYGNGSICNYGTNYPAGSTCYNGSNYNNYNGGLYQENGYTAGHLTCAPALQTVDNGQTASFTAYGSTGPFTWTVGGRNFFAIGSQLNTVLPGTGTQNVQVSNGVQTASCTVTVTNKQYLPGIVLGASTAIPGLPNTGYEPSTVGIALALLGALVAFPLALLLAYQYAKRTSFTFTR
jgi:hypothetical protein